MMTDFDIGGQASASDSQVMSEQDLVARGWNDPRVSPLGYWRIPDDRMTDTGFRITILQYGANSNERTERGHEKIPRYGTYKANDSMGQWRPWTDPYLAIVQRGGIREFDAQQIIDLGWQWRPTRQAKDSHKQLWKAVDAAMAGGLSETDAIYAVMPQLRGRDLTAYLCEFCPGRKFPSSASLHSHQANRHEANVRSKEIQNAITGAMKQSNGGNDELKQAMAVILKLLADRGGESEPEKRGPGRPRKGAEVV